MRQTDLVTLLIDRTLANLTDAETGQRGYLLTGDTLYLAPYRQGAPGSAPTCPRFAR